MAAEGKIKGKGQGDLDAHADTYSLFTRLMTRGAIVCLVIAFVVIILLKA